MTGIEALTRYILVQSQEATWKNAHPLDETHRQLHESHSSLPSNSTSAELQLTCLVRSHYPTGAGIPRQDQNGRDPK